MSAWKPRLARLESASMMIGSVLAGKNAKMFNRDVGRYSSKNSFKNSFETV